MSILFQISIEVNSGSVGRIAEQIGEVAMSYGWESYITYARKHLPSKSKTIRIGKKWDIYWHGMITRLFDRHCLSSTRATKRLIEQIEAIKPDIIQLHHIHGYFLNMRVLFAYLSSIDTPVVWIFHDCWAMTGHCSHFDYVGCEKWKVQCYDCIQKKAYPASLIADCSKKNFNLKKTLFTSVTNMTIVPVSSWLGSIVQQSYLNKYPVEVIHNGIDIIAFSPQKEASKLREDLGLTDSIVLLGVASIWDQRKGLDEFIKLSSLIPDNWKIILVGLKKYQIERLPKQVTGIERTENVQQLATLYTIADVFINPTWEDTFPTTNLEAMACGTPVITYKTGGSVESISPETGFVVEKGDVNGIKECVEEVLLKGKDKYLSFCRRRALDFYNKSERFEDYIKLYNKLLQK